MGAAEAPARGPGQPQRRTGQAPQTAADWASPTTGSRQLVEEQRAAALGGLHELQEQRRLAVEQLAEAAAVDLGHAAGGERPCAQRMDRVVEHREVLAEELARADEGDNQLLALGGLAQERHLALESLVAQIRAAGGDGFRAFEVATWREDWPDKREASVARVRRLVAEAAADDGPALVVPARATGRGAGEELLAGLDFAYGHGFAPHPLFVEWVEAEVVRGIADLAAGSAAGGDGATGR